MSFRRELLERDLAAAAKRHGLRLVRGSGGSAVLVEAERDMFTVRFEPDKPRGRPT